MCPHAGRDVRALGLQPLRGQGRRAGAGRRRNAELRLRSAYLDYEGYGCHIEDMHVVGKVVFSLKRV